MEKVFPKGFIFKPRREKAPEFIKAHISVKVDEFTAFLKEHAKDNWVNIDVCLSAGGKLYTSLNQFEPTKKDVEASDLPF